MFTLQMFTENKDDIESLNATNVDFSITQFGWLNISNLFAN